MVLVDLTVDGSGGLLVTLLDDVLVDDGGSNLFVDSGVMVTSLVPVQMTCQWQLRDTVFRREQRQVMRRWTDSKPSIISSSSG